LTLWWVKKPHEINLQIRTAGGEGMAEMLELNACQPGRLLDTDASPLAWIMNQMLYDKFHGNGWKLNLLTGAFEKV